jgi:hypothetical protein
MSRMHGATLGIAVAVLMSLGPAGAAQAAPSIVLPRPGQVGVGVAGGYGVLLESGKLGKEFSSGPALTVRLRYRMRYERMAGLVFEGRTYDARALQPTDSLFARKQLRMILSGLEFAQLFGSRTRTTKMLTGGFGIAQPSFKLNDGETEYPNGDFYRSWAFDLETRYVAVFQDGKANHDLQASLGLIFYASY